MEAWQEWQEQNPETSQPILSLEISRNARKIGMNFLDHLLLLQNVHSLGVQGHQSVPCLAQNAQSKRQKNTIYVIYMILYVKHCLTIALGSLKAAFDLQHF